ncbi:MAG: BspA family leucine-rich repeat surface protein [archaeon]|nr:BspA family leucine-rich repeat surface protein [archaeon]
MKGKNTNRNRKKNRKEALEVSPPSNPKEINSPEAEKIKDALNQGIDSPGIGNDPTSPTSIPSPEPNVIKEKEKEIIPPLLFSSSYYYCPTCKRIPHQKLNEDSSIEISNCKCNTKEKITMDSFAKTINSFGTLTDCELCKEKKERLKAYKPKHFCKDCSKFICLECLEGHDKTHKVKDSTQMNTDPSCETLKCQGEIKYYCDICHMHICQSCKDKHHSKNNKHLPENLIKMGNYYNEEKLKDFTAGIDKITYELKTDSTKFENYLNYIDHCVKDCREKLAKKRRIETNTISYFNSLLKAYQSTKSSLNYNARKNLLDNQPIMDQFISRQKTEFDNMVSEFKININDEKKCMDLSSKYINENPNKEEKLCYIEASYFVKPEYFYKEDFEKFGRFNILGDEFNFFNNENCLLFIDGLDVPFTKQFTTEGKHEVKIVLRPEVNPLDILSTENMFYLCTSLCSVNLSNFITTNVKNMSYMFSSCMNLVTINGIYSMSTGNVTNMSYMFSRCPKLTSLNLSSFDTSNVENFEGIFLYCSKLESIEGLSSLNTQKVTNMSYMFSECPKINSLDLSKFNTKSVTDMSHMFDGDTSLSYLDLTGFSTENVNTMLSMFSGCSSLKELNLSHFNTKKVTNMYQMFTGCSSLIDIKLSGFDTTSVTNMFQMFSGCKAIKILNLSNFKTTNLRNVEGMFKGCSELEEVDLSQFDTKNVYDMNQMFHRCSNLKVIKANECNTQFAYQNKGIFKGCNKLDEETKRKFKK